MRAVIVWALLAVAAMPLAAQDDRRDRQDPELVVEAGGRSGTCDAILFDATGANLYAAGDDKVARIWACGPEGLDAGKQRIVRWPSWRERRGGIKALAISPDGKRIFVGGYGAKATTVAVIDPWADVSGKIEEIALPVAKDAAGTPNAFAVMTAGFSKDGSLRTFGTSDGSVWIWKRGGKPQLLGKHAPIPPRKGEEPSPFNRTRLSAFTPTGKVFSVSQSGEMLVFAEKDGSYRETLRKSRIVLEKYPGGVFRAAMSDDGTWLALGVNGPLVALCYLPDPEKPLKEYALQKGEFVRAVAFDCESKTLAVGVGGVLDLNGFSIDGDDHILLFNEPLGPGALKPAAGPRHSFRADALAFHPDGRLAVAGGDHHEVTLWNLKKPEQPQSLIAGKGRNIWGVRISVDGSSIGYQMARDPLSKDPNCRGAGEFLAFSLEKGRPVTDKQTWVEPLGTLGGWTVAPDPQNRFVWYAVHKEKNWKYALPIDPNRDEAPRCWTFLPGRDGNTVQLVVGHFYGCSIFDLQPEGVTRRFVCIGHAGEVMAVAPSKDGSWFVTAGMDQTIAAWNTADWKSLPAFGALLAPADRHVLVKSVEPGSPAWEMGLIENDRIVFMAVDKKPVFNHCGVYDKLHGPENGSAKDLIDELRKPQPGTNYTFYWMRAGKPQQGVTSLPRRPIWRFFPAFDRQGIVTDWVVWLWWKPYYLTSSAGDSLLGISINNEDLTATPTFHRLDQFDAELHQRKILLDVLKTRDLESVLREVRSVSIGEKEPNPVTIKAEVQSGNVVLTLTVREKTKNPDYVPIQIDLWINNYRYQRWRHDGGGFSKTLPVPVEMFHDGGNQVTLQTFNRVGGRGEARANVDVKRPQSQSRLFGLFVGVNSYTKSKVRLEDGVRGPLGNLNFATNDARRMYDEWLKQAGEGKLFAKGRQKLLLDAEVTPDAIIKDLKAFAREARTDDLLVVFFSGHGDLVDANKKSGRGGTFVFCCPDYNQEMHSTTGVPTQVLANVLADIPCRKLILLDACRSGQAANVNLARELVPGRIGMTILTACDQGELAYESNELKNGLFTSAVLEAIGPRLKVADEKGDKNQMLDPNELYWYIRNRMESLRKETNKPAQSPLCFPFDPERFPIAR